MERGLNISRQLKHKIASLDISKPYVWRLRLSETDFQELEDCLSGGVSNGDVSALVRPENALTTLVYLAEWYKRRYRSGNRCELIGNLDLEALWTNVGISRELYLYEDENGNKRWLYSIYVLGGLAIKHELGRNDNLKFLKGLCRIYHGENYTLENLDEASRAIAFRESIKRRHSLYEYLKEILNGRLPFHPDDLKDSQSDANRFVAILKTANDEILRVKFRFEWNVTFSPDYTHMTRRLRVLLKPEEVGGELHQYLRYDRARLWGVPNPETLRFLYIYIAYKDGEKMVEPSAMERPILTYLNNGEDAFIAFGVEKGVLIKHIPATRFDRIDIIAKDDAGNEYLAQSQETTEFMQLWRTDSYGDTWTSARNAQRETALLFTNRCRLKDETSAAEVYRKRFSDRRFGTTEIWNWVYIYDSISFYDWKGRECCLYNRMGYDQITTRLYTDTIRYVGGGKVKHFYIDDPDISEEYDTEELPLIFGREDLIVRHFATKDDILNARPDMDTVAEQIEYQLPNGRYAAWTGADGPPYGKVILRIAIKGASPLFTAVYLPRLDNERPISRDFDTTSIRYRTFDGEAVLCRDHIPMDGKTLAPTLPIQYGDGDSHYEVDVYRPTLLKEVMLDGHIVRYLDGDEPFRLPYIFKDRVQVNDFSRQGYQVYECKNLGNIYTQDFINIARNPTVGEAALNAWRQDKQYVGKRLDAMAPDCLVVCFGNSQANSCWKYVEALFWNYDEQTEPEPVNPDKDAASKEVGVIFQDIRRSESLCCNLSMDIDNEPWEWEGIHESVLKCFEVANRYGIYFFLMKPLRDIKKRSIFVELYEQLLEARGGILEPETKQGLLRLSKESGFSWQEFAIHIDND